MIFTLLSRSLCSILLLIQMINAFRCSGYTSMLRYSQSHCDVSHRFLRIPPQRLHKLFGGFQKSEVDPGEVKGTKLRILKYPHPQLRAPNEVISTFDDSLKQMAKEMLMVMYAADGIGLAAPQVGINKRLMVFNEAGEPEKKEQEMVLVNPVITAKSEETNLREEGCLSFPQIHGTVQRHTWVEVEYQAISGEKKKTRLEGFNARIFQHEFDHLDKVLFIDHFNDTDKAENQKRLDKFIKKYGPGGAP